MENLVLEVPSDFYCQYQADSCIVCVGHSSKAGAVACVDDCDCHEKWGVPCRKSESLFSRFKKIIRNIRFF